MTLHVITRPETVKVSDGGTQTDPMTSKDALTAIAKNIFETVKSFTVQHIAPSVAVGVFAALGAGYQGAQIKELPKIVAGAAACTLSITGVARIAMYCLRR